MLNPLSWPSSWFHKEEPTLVTELNLKIDILYASDADLKKYYVCLTSACCKWHENLLLLNQMPNGIALIWENTETQNVSEIVGLWYQKWRKQSTKWIQEDFWVPKKTLSTKGQDPSLTFFARSFIWTIPSIFCWEERKCVLNGSITWPRWPSCSYLVKNLIHDPRWPYIPKGKTLVRLCECVGCPC